jgi:hypothetical protein
MRRTGAKLKGLEQPRLRIVETPIPIGHLIHHEPVASGAGNMQMHQRRQG